MFHQIYMQIFRRPQRSQKLEKLNPLAGRRGRHGECAMRWNVSSKRNEAREERKRQELATGLLSDRFPNVSSIVVTMNCGRGSRSAVLRTLNYYPGSHAFFRIRCLSEGCDEGVLDLTHPIQKMIRSHETSAKGELCCDINNPEIVHPDVDLQRGHHLLLSPRFHSPGGCRA